jgi:hypothetical protein
MSSCPFHLQTDRAACTRVGHPYLPSLAEIEEFCRRGGYRSCPIYAVEGGGGLRLGDEAYWLLGPSCPA